MFHITICDTLYYYSRRRLALRIARLHEPPTPLAGWLCGL